MAAALSMPKTIPGGSSLAVCTDFPQKLHVCYDVTFSRLATLLEMLLFLPNYVPVKTDGIKFDIRSTLYCSLKSRSTGKSRQMSEW